MNEMTLTETLKEFIDERAKEREGLAHESRERVKAWCREQHARQIWQVLVLEPTPEEFGFVRDEIKKLLFDEDYCGSHQFVLDDFDKGHEILF